MLASLFVNQYKAEDEVNEEDDEIADPLWILNETLRSNVVNHTATGEDEDDDLLDHIETNTIHLICLDNQVVDVFQSDIKWNRSITTNLIG